MKLKYKSIFFFLNISLHTFHKFTRTFTFTAIRIARQTNRFANIRPTRVSINPIRIRSPRRTRKTTGHLVSPLSYRWPINLQAHTLYVTSIDIPGVAPSRALRPIATLRRATLFECAHEGTKDIGVGGRCTGTELPTIGPVYGKCVHCFLVQADFHVKRGGEGLFNPPFSGLIYSMFGTYSSIG